MKPDHLYQDLKELAEKLGIIVSEQNLRTAGISVNSGYCKIKGRSYFIMDKHAHLHKKIDLLADCLSKLPIDDLYVLPAVRTLLEKKKELSPPEELTKSPSQNTGGGTV